MAGTVTPLSNGPLKVSGEIQVFDAQGKALPASTKDGAVYLCRCGASSSKPFCDGGHKRVDFKG